MSKQTEETYLPHIAYDSVIFGFSGEKLKILIMEYRNTGWFALPGGFVRHNENLNAAVRRGLKERTGLDNIYLEQFYTFGDLDRSKPDLMADILKANGHVVEEYQWMLNRFISVAYYALIDYNKVQLNPDALSDSINWYGLDELPELIFDHDKIVEKALEVLRRNIEYKILGTNLLPRQFTMKELKKVYEGILGKELSRTNFQRKMLSLGILQRHEKKYSGKAHKAPYLYSFLNND